MNALLPPAAMPEPSDFLTRLLSWFWRRWFWRLCAHGLRLLLAVGFIIPALPKMQYKRFMNVPSYEPGHPAYFFECVYQTPIWYQAMGYAQFLAAVLLLIPRLRTMGALLYLTVVANIFLITISIPFAYTPVITGLMTLGALALVMWDYPRWRPLFTAPLPGPGRKGPAPSERG